MCVCVCVCAYVTILDLGLCSVGTSCARQCIVFVLTTDSIMFCYVVE